jgi:signal transduction histidine kinase
MKPELDHEKVELNATAPEAPHDNLVLQNARLRGDLLTVARRISHDLRTPLGGIISAGEMLKEILAEQNPASVVLVAPFFDSADGMTQLIERVSFLLKASLHPASKEKVQMGEVVFNVRQRLESIVLKKNATILESAGWPEVNAVNSWLEVVWWNLLANALQHGKGLIELGWQEGNAELRFWVCDNGDGVPADKRDKLFQPFHTLYEANASRGLGLSIVQRMMELQGGNCGYEPRLDGGSCFYFTLPVQ